MEIVVEFIFELIFEGILELYTSWRKKKNPNYDNTKFKKVIDVFIKIIIVVLILVVFIGLIFFIEWLFPELFDIIDFS